jgi:hypothetical protein
MSLAQFRIFLNNREDIRNSRCTTSDNDIDSKLTTGVIDTGGKFTAVVTAISANLRIGVTAGVIDNAVSTKENSGA